MEGKMDNVSTNLTRPESELEGEETSITRIGWIGGITVTGMRLDVAAATSISDGVIFIDAIILRPELAAITSASTLSAG